jgi:hypothetical protein
VRAEAPMKGIIDFLYRLNKSALLIKVEKLILSLKDENTDILKTNFLAQWDCIVLKIMEV